MGKPCLHWWQEQKEWDDVPWKRKVSKTAHMIDQSSFPDQKKVCLHIYIQLMKTNRTNFDPNQYINFIVNLTRSIPQV